VLEANLDPETDKVVTDAAPVYTALIPADKHEENINQELIRKRGFSATYTVDNALALFQRGIIGSYHKMSKDHMDSYLGEFCWRFNRRHMQPYMFDLALRNLSERKPLPFKKLTREVF
jgi:predicted ATP-grasp superfamily ATP-dependent carboligase